MFMLLLGRPWNDLATTVFLRTYMDDSIAPAGFKPYDSARPVIMNTTFYAEYKSFGRFRYSFQFLAHALTRNLLQVQEEIRLSACRITSSAPSKRKTSLLRKCFWRHHAGSISSTNFSSNE